MGSKDELVLVAGEAGELLGPKSDLIVIGEESLVGLIVDSVSDLCFKVEGEFLVTTVDLIAGEESLCSKVA